MTNEEIFNKIKSGEITKDMFDVFVEVEKQKSLTIGLKEGFHNGVVATVNEKDENGEYCYHISRHGKTND